MGVFFLKALSIAILAVLVHVRSQSPTPKPTFLPTLNPTSVPTTRPTSFPTAIPTALPIAYPTSCPSSRPSSRPSLSPSNPTLTPSSQQSSSSKRRQSLVVLAIVLPAVAVGLALLLIPVYYCMFHESASSDRGGVAVNMALEESARAMGGLDAKPEEQEAPSPSAPPVSPETGEPPMVVVEAANEDTV